VKWSLKYSDIGGKVILLEQNDQFILHCAAMQMLHKNEKQTVKPTQRKMGVLCTSLPLVLLYEYLGAYLLIGFL
jgi:hypothetical protein